MIKKFQVYKEKKIKNVVKQMDKSKIGIAICVDKNKKVVGVFTDGDFRKAVYNGVDLNKKVDKIMNKNFVYVSKNYSNNKIKKIFKNNFIQYIPVLSRKKLINLVERKFFFREKDSTYGNMNNQVVIVAGGKGQRLAPFTEILPKPLIPINDEPIIKKIMEEFYKFDMKNFHITLFDKAKMIKGYFHDHGLPFQIKYYEETKPLGTAGSLFVFKKKFENPVFVTNCDIILKANYNEILKFHKKNNHDLTIVASMRHLKIPYGVCKINKNGTLIGVTEKPEYDFLVNTGFYLLNPKLFKIIPKNRYLDMTDFFKIVKNKNLNIGVFPVSNNSWYDVGKWDEYDKNKAELL